MSLFEPLVQTDPSPHVQPVLLKMRERAIHLHGASKVEHPFAGDELAALTGRPRLTVATTLGRRHSLPTPHHPAQPSSSYAHPEPITYGVPDSRVVPAQSAAGGAHQHLLHQPSASFYGMPSASYAAAPSASTSAAGPHMHPYASTTPQEFVWEVPQQGPYQYAPEGGAPAVDFNLGDAWTTFMQNYAGL